MSSPPSNDGDFTRRLAEVGYDDVLSIENEDESQPPQEGVRKAAMVMRSIMPARPLAEDER